MSNIVFMNGKDVIAENDTYYAEGYRAWGPNYQLMAEDLRFYLGDQWLLREQQYLREQGREMFTVNKLKSKIDWITGYQIQNRLSSVCVPVQNASQQTADQFSKLLINDLATDGYSTISECFSSACKTGWSLANLYLDYNTDPVDGDLKWCKEPYSAFICDPYFTKLDMSDCNWLMKRRYLSPLQAANLLPGQEDEVTQLARDGWERDNKFTWMVFQRIPTGQRMMAYNELWRLKYEPQKVIYNRMTGRQADWDGDEENMRLMWHLARQQGHELDILTRKRQFVEKHIILNNTYMRTEINPYGLDEYPFQLFTPIFEPESEEYTYKIQSLIRMLRDPQRELNKRRSQMIDVIESKMNTGWIEMNGAVKNPKMLYQSGQGKRIVLNEGFQLDSVREIQPAQIPPNFFQEFDVAEKDLMDILSLTPTTMGQVETKQTSTALELQRQASALVGLQEVFERMREAQRSLGRKQMKIYQNWSPEKVARIIGERPTQEFYDKSFLKYDCQVQEGINTNTQRYMFFRQVMELKELGEPIPPGELTKLAPLQGKAEFMQDVKQFQQQQEQAQQAQMQIQQQQQEAAAQALQSRAVSDIALSREREARSMADLGLQEERNAEALQNREKAALDHVKAIQEMEKLETEHRAAKDERTHKMFEFFQVYEAHLKMQQDLKTQEQRDQVQNSGPQQAQQQPSLS